MAQHHSQLKPWEICNKDLTHGAVVAYYRSPFPNVSAAAIAINNTKILQDKSREAFTKDGVAYMPLWTPKEIAIIDYDGDNAGFFVGFTATVDNLPEQIRAELASIEYLPLAQQYEEWRSTAERMVRQVEQGQEARMTPADYPLSVKALIERNAPDIKPRKSISNRSRSISGKKVSLKALRLGEHGELPQIILLGWLLTLA